MKSIPRYVEIDLIRTCAIIGMIVYHTLFMGWFFFQWENRPLEGWQWILARSTSTTFLLLVGISFVLASQRKHTATEIWQRAFRRGATVFGAGMIVTAFTFLFIEGVYIRFGILHCIGVSMMILPFFRTFKEWNLLFAFLFIVIGLLMEDIALSTGFFMPLGMPGPDFRSLDYFPLFPNFGTVLIGLAVGSFLFERINLKPHLDPQTWRLITWPGRHSLIVYLVHPLVVYGVLWALF